MKEVKSLTIVDVYKPESGLATEFRRLLHNITSPQGEVSSKSFLVTSATLSEGKSTVASFLAITAAAFKQKKTILIDCDLRRPVIHKLFGLPLENGVTDLIAKGDSVALEDAVKPTSIPHLSVLTAGSRTDDPTMLFENDSVRRLIEQVKFYSDLVIIDCAPIIPVSDPVTLSAQVDSVVLVVRAGVTPRDVVKRGLDLIRRSEIHLAGVVLNDIHGAMPHQGYYHYYQYDSSVKAR